MLDSVYEIPAFRDLGGLCILISCWSSLGTEAFGPGGWWVCGLGKPLARPLGPGMLSLFFQEEKEGDATKDSLDDLFPNEEEEDSSSDCESARGAAGGGSRRLLQAVAQSE